MNTQLKRLFALASLLGVLLPGPAAAESPAPPGSPLPEAGSDARRIELHELESLLLEHASNPQVSDQVVVDDRPVLTDRGFIHVPAADFTPTTEQAGGASGVFWSEGGFVYGGSSSFFTEAVAAVFLPHGVTVNLVAVTAVDDSTHHLALSLRRQLAYPNPTTDLMAYIETDSDNAGVGIWLDDTINQPVIDNNQYQYYLFAENLTTEKKLRSVFIHYEH